jgi:hypothetical protein
MKKVLMMALALTMCAGAASADHIGIYGDPAGNQCWLSTLSGPPASNNFYVVHKLNAGSTASQWKVNDTSGLFPTTQIAPAGYLTIGTWNTDMSIAYGGCVIGDHVILTLSFLWFGAPANCNQTLALVPAPTSPIPGEVALVDCAQPSGNLETATAGTGYNLPGCVTGSCDPNATASTTWGQIKSLYR